MLLDIHNFPREAWYGEGDERVDLARLVFDASQAIDGWAAKGVITGVKSFGFAAAHPGSYADWDDPYKFVWFVTGWGPEQKRYIANAVRKLRATLRERRDTIALLSSDCFLDVVDSANDDGEFEWGDFPKAGAVLAKVEKIVVPAATSCFPQVEDHPISLGFGGLVGARVLSIDEPERFGRPRSTVKQSG